MNDFSFIELLIKQTCRRSSYEFDMGSRQSTEDSSSIYSLDFLKKLYDKPRDNIHRLLKIPEQTLNGVGVKLGNGINLLNDQDFTKVEKRTFLDFLNKIKDMEPPKAKYWVDLQHYMHYVYRNFVSCNPDACVEVLSITFLNELREFVKLLLDEDESQLYLRLFALLREYCIFAHWNFSKLCDKEKSITITTLFYYYEAMLSAAKCISSVFPELEALLHKNYSVCWIDFNNCIFIHYFFETEYVQNRIYEFQNKINPTEAPKMYELLGNLRNLWIREQKRINELNETSIIDVTSELYDTEVFMLEQHRKILSQNFWIDRSKELKDRFDLSRLDHHIFRLLGDQNLQTAGPILDKNGQCICEECLVAKYKYFLDQDQINEIAVMNTPRSTYCRKCQNIVDLNVFQQHINNHSLTEDHKSLLLNGTTNLSRIISQKIDLVNNLSDKLSVTSLDDEITKKLGPKAIPTQNKISYSDITNELPLSGEIPLRTKTSVFEEFLKHRKEIQTSKSDQVLTKNVRNFIKIKKDLFNNSSGFTFKHSSSSVIKSETPKDADLKLRELLKNGKPTSINNQVSSKETQCKHSCKHEDELKSELKKGCKGSCDHHKESKKCDCTYCEVFGTAVSSHTHKKSELRDKLRIRLHQRREKRTKDSSFKTSPTVTTTINNSKVQKSINNVEERVPPPIAAVNPAPVVQVSNLSPDLTNDIHGLLNYIEGNTSNDKMAIAQKKAAKKERQRQKKEEERLKLEEEERRKQEEERRKEEERKRAEDLAKQLAEKARIKSLHQCSKKERKRNRNKINSQKLALSKDVLEETIPAMVTIKRVAESGSSQPTVTITLKGSTPDQDKLLYTLVNGADSKQAEPENNRKDGSSNNSKKKNNKKNNSQQKKPESTVITKELKVTLALDPSNKTEENKKSKKKIEKFVPKPETNNDKKGQEVNLPMLRLPPGITITKVEGPIANRNYKASNLQDQPPSSTINVGKSGVIVVDTEKLIQQNGSSTIPKGKKSRRKKKKITEATPASSSQMITLKNPIFQSLHSKPPETIAERNMSNECAPAAIFTSENGMVTIRSSRLQQSLNNGEGAGSNGMTMAMPSLLSDLKPVIGPEMSKNSFANKPAETQPQPAKLSPFNAQEILSGLPGIEITKVDKRSGKSEHDTNKSCQTAQVSIIPANNGDKFTLDKDDWTYDSVFTPKDILEDDMDADERELEAFKRFCQQSVPPKQKEKVAHLNVKDIVLKKKNDTNCV